jgi:hypothetical protein
MRDFFEILAMAGVIPYILGITIAFGAIALYFGFIKKS